MPTPDVNMVTRKMRRLAGLPYIIWTTPEHRDGAKFPTITPSPKCISGAFRKWWVGGQQFDKDCHGDHGRKFKKKENMISKLNFSIKEV